MLDDTVLSGDWPDMNDAIVHLRRLARTGCLAQTARNASRGDHARLSGAAFAVAAPLVFNRVTRGFEVRRGHRACAISLRRMADDCLDRFYDDTEAVVTDILTHANAPILNLEGWIVPRLRVATVNAHRIRRGQRGALQRPRLPGWLGLGLGGDRWLGQLAIEILTWVGVEATSGTAIWPVDAWAERRGTMTGDWATSTASTVEREVEQVLRVMRRKPKWYEDHVERPLGAKWAPAAPAGVARGLAADPPPLALVEPHELDEARITTLATLALHAIECGVRAGEDIHTVVASVVATVFGRADPRRDLADTPHATASADECADALLGDPEAMDRVVAEVMLILGIAPDGRRLDG